MSTSQKTTPTDAQDVRVTVTTAEEPCASSGCESPAPSARAHRPHTGAVDDLAYQVFAD